MKGLAVEQTADMLEVELELVEEVAMALRQEGKLK